jgi:tetratricopeptide (TPR) repeat protein
MKILKTLISFVVISLCASNLQAQNISLDCRLTKSYTNQDVKNWGAFVDEISKDLSKNYSHELLFTRMLVRHFYVAQLLFNKGDSKEISAQMTGMSKDLDALEKLPAYAPHCMAFRAALNSYSAISSPFTAVYYLPKSFSIIKSAAAKSPQSPYVWAEYGNLEYGYREFLGGNFNDAIAFYKKSLTLFEQRKQNTACNWYYVNTLLFLAKSYEGNKNYAEANRVYDTILKLIPTYEAINRWKQKNVDKEVALKEHK